MGGGVLNSVPSPVLAGQLNMPVASSVEPSTLVPAAVMVVWQMTEGLGKAGEGGVLGDAAFLGYMDMVPEEAGEVGAKLSCLGECELTLKSSGPLLARREMVNWFGSFPSFLNISGSRRRRAFMNQLQT